MESRQVRRQETRAKAKELLQMEKKQARKDKQQAKRAKRVTHIGTAIPALS